MADKEDEISIVDVYLKLRDTLQFLWTKKIPILIAGALGGALGFTNAFLKPVEYEAKLTFIVEQNDGSKGLGDLSGIASSFGLGGVGGQGGLYNNQVNLMNYLKSRSVIEECYLRTIPGTQTVFAERFAKEYGWKEDWSEDSVLCKIQFVAGKPRHQYTRIEDSILFEMYNYIIEQNLLTVSIPDNEGSIINIAFKSLDDTISRHFTETLLSIVSHNYIEKKTKKARENVELIQYQTDSVRAALNEALVKAANSTDQVFGLNPALNIRRVPATKEQIDIHSSTAMLEQLTKNLELARLQLLDETPLIEIIDSPRFPLEKIKTSKKTAFVVSFFLFAVLTVFGLIIHRFVKKIATL